MSRLRGRLNPTRRLKYIYCVKTYAADIPKHFSRFRTPDFPREPRELWTLHYKVAEEIAQGDERAGGGYHVVPHQTRRCPRCGRWMIGLAAQLQKEHEVLAWLSGKPQLPCSKDCVSGSFNDFLNDFGSLLYWRGYNGYKSDHVIDCETNPGSRGGKIPTVQRDALDIRFMRQRGFLVPGTRFSVCWDRSGMESGGVCGYATEDAIVFSYKLADQSAPEGQECRVQLLCTPCNYGGERRWFKCPAEGCSRRVAILYRKGNTFACRKVTP